MNCIIIEDQPPAQRILKKYIGEVGSLNLLETFSDAIQALAFLKTASVELIFLDIHLPKLSGIDFLKSMPHPPAVILTTAFPDYALESYELDVVDYLLKPFSFQRFVQAVAKVPNRLTRENKEADSPERQELFIKSGYEHIKVIIEDILYIKSDADYTEIFVSGKKHLSSEPLRHWLELLGEQQFVRVHKSYVINADKVEKIAGNQLYLLDDRVIPIGRAYKEEVLERFLR